MLAEITGPIYSRFREDLDFRELLEDFVVSARERRTSLEASFAERSVQELGRQAHQIKGAGGGYGFDSLSQVAALLEIACQKPEPSIDEIGQLLNDVIDHLNRVAV